MAGRSVLVLRSLLLVALSATALASTDKSLRCADHARNLAIGINQDPSTPVCTRFATAAEMADASKTMSSASAAASFGDMVDYCYPSNATERDALVSLIGTDMWNMACVKSHVDQCHDWLVYSVSSEKGVAEKVCTDMPTASALGNYFAGWSISESSKTFMGLNPVCYNESNPQPLLQSIGEKFWNTVCPSVLANSAAPPIPKEKPQAGDSACSRYSNCPSCVTDLNCGWCVSENGAKCIVGNVVGALCTANCSVSYEYAFCSGEPCGRMYGACNECVRDPFCIWCQSTSSCTEGNVMGPIDKGIGCTTYSHGHCGTTFTCSASTQTVAAGTSANSAKQAKVENLLKQK